MYIFPMAIIDNNCTVLKNRGAAQIKRFYSAISLNGIAARHNVIILKDVNKQCFKKLQQNRFPA